MKHFLFILCFFSLSCSTSSKSNFEEGSSFKGRFVASEFTSDHFIPFPSGAIHPVGFSASAEYLQNFRNTSQVKAKNRGIMTDEDCFSGDSSGYIMYCTILEAERALTPLPRGNPLKRLSSEEYASIAWFADFGYQDYNSALWSQNPEELTKHEVGIKIALSGLNRLTGESRRVLRCDLGDQTNKLSEDEITRVGNRYEENKTYRIKGFWSTSRGTDPDYIEQWIKPCYVQLTIQLAGSGADISAISSRPFEQEILVRPMTQFIVSKKTVSQKNGKPFYEIELSEVK